jgi:hypothetical protein
MSPQNGGFIREFWLVPDSCGKEFSAVAGECELFFSTKFEKKIYRDFCKGEKTIPVGFFTKSNSSELNIYIYNKKNKNIFNVVVQAKFIKLLPKQNKTKQNTKDQDKHGVFIRARMRKSGDRYAFYIYYFYVLNHKTFTYYANTVYLQNPPHLFTLEPKAVKHSKFSRLTSMISTDNSRVGFIQLFHCSKREETIYLFIYLFSFAN